MRTSAKISALLKRKAGVRIDLGCGFHKQDENWIGVDRRKTPAVDIVHDLEVFPYPLPDSCATAIAMSHVWEHITPKHTLSVMDEMWRICRPKASVFISGPYGMGYRYMQDPTHCNPSVEATFLYWDPDHPLYQVYQTKARLKIVGWDIVPVGGDRDFSVVLQVIK